jgi:RNase P subunit RPR2
MRRPSGLILETSLDTGKVREIETTMCLHCGKHSIAWKRERPEELGGICYTCKKAACPKCMDDMWNGKTVCVTLEEKLQRAANQEYFRTRMKEW